MKINKILKLSFQNIKRNKRKNSILFIPLTFLLILLFITSTIQYSIYAYLDKLSQSLELRTISEIDYPEKRYEEIKEQIEQIEHVEWVYNQEVKNAFSIFICQEFIYGKAEGYSIIYPITSKVYPELLAGRPINEGEKYVALIPSKIYASSEFRKVQDSVRDDEYLNGVDFLGQEITVKSDEDNLEYTFTVVGVYDSDKNNENKKIYIPEETVREINQKVSYKPEYFRLNIVVDDFKNIKYVKQQMKEKNLINQSPIVQIASQYKENDTVNANITAATSISMYSLEIIEILINSFLIMIAILLFIIILVTNFNKSYLSTMEIGLKKIEGYTNKNIHKISIVENIIVCIISAITALIITLIIIQLFNLIINSYIAEYSIGITESRIKEQLYYIQKMDKKINPLLILLITFSVIMIESLNTFLINRRILSKKIINILH